MNPRSPVATATPRRYVPSTVAEVTALLGGGVYLVDEEVTALSRCASDCDRTMVEIGAAFGGSTGVLLASASDSTQLHSIDPFVVDSMGQWSASEFECRRNVTTFLVRLGRYDCVARWTLHPRASYDVVASWTDPIQMIFIDGDHVYPAVKRDFEDWYPHVEQDGLILIHDSRRIPDTPDHEFNRGWHGPTQLAEELERDPRVELVDVAHSLTIWRRV